MSTTWCPTDRMNKYISEVIAELEHKQQIQMVYQIKKASMT